MKIPFYAAEYEGEFIIHHTTIEDGKRIEDREWIPATITNNDHRGNAVIVGNGNTRSKFRLSLLTNHKGGLFASLKCQVYGCNAVYRDMVPDFLIAQTDEIVTEIVESGYADKNIVYSSAAQMVKHPGKLHLIPQNYILNAGAGATYLACFHGHKKVYLIGFDNQDSKGFNNNMYAGTNGYQAKNETISSGKWVANMERLFRAYHDVEFYWVHPNPDHCMPEKWKWCNNLHAQSYREFVSDLDIG